MESGGDAIGDRLRAALGAVGTLSDAGAPRHEMWREGRCVLYRYEPQAPQQVRIPLLICYALVNRPTMLDLQPGHSLIRNLLAAGVSVYLLDWGYPQSADRHEQLDDYVNGWLHECIVQVSQDSGGARSAAAQRNPVNLLGVCQGGVLSLCHAALHPGMVQNLVTMVTPVDFQTPQDLLSRWARDIDTELMGGLGNIPGALLNALYMALLPFRLSQQKYLSMALLLDDPAELEHFMRMEHWIGDSPDQAAIAFTQFVKWFYQENRLLKGTLSLGGRPVNLRAIRCPILNLYGLRDHLVPADASRALRGLAGSRDYEELALDLGHIGMYVSRRAQQAVAPAIAAWLAARDG